MTLLCSVLLFLVPPGALVDRMSEADTLCHKDDTTCRESVISRIDEGRLCLRTQNGLPCLGDRFRGGWIVDLVLEYWYENRNSPLSIRINDEIGPATIGLVQEA